MQPRLTLDQCQARISEIMSSLQNHAGRRAIFIVSDGRMKTTVLGRLVRVDGKMYAEYKDYTKGGSLRGTRRMFINPVLIHTGELEVEYLDDGV